MKKNEKYYTSVISEKLAPYYDEKKHGSPDNFIDIISESVKRTIDYYEANFDFDDDDFDNEIFESDLLSDAKNALRW